LQFTVLGLPEYQAAQIYGSDVTGQKEAQERAQQALAQLDVVVNTSAVVESPEHATGGLSGQTGRYPRFCASRKKVYRKKRFV
jgi:hypothetical protein